MNLTNYTEDTMKNLQKIIRIIESRGVEMWFIKSNKLQKLKDFLSKRDFKKRVIFIWGKQISGSLSPFMHTYSSVLSGKLFLYTLFDMEKIVAGNSLKQAITVSVILKYIEKNDDILGANVTMPYKIEVYEYLKNKSSLDISAKLVWAVNTIAKDNSWNIIWYNTDIDWIINPITEKLWDNLNNIKTCCILWAGWASRAVVASILKMGIKKIIIFNKSRENAEKLINHFNKEEIKNLLENKDFEIRYVEYDVGRDGINRISTEIQKPWILINTLPFGFKENLPKLPILETEWQSIKNNISLVFDIVYDMVEWDTPFLKIIKKDNVETCDGRDMLIGQAIRWFKLWSGWEKFQEEDIKKFLK